MTKARRKKTGQSLTLPVLSVPGARAWALWLQKNHADSPGVWLCLRKKNCVLPGITYSEALDEALCQGWIDGQVKTYDENFWIQRFTQRRRRSSWSKRNTQHAARLIRSGKMRPAGLAEVTAARKDGRWKAAYDPPSTATVPDDFLKALRRMPKALKFFNSLNKANRYAIAYRLQTAKKPETRERRMKLILAMMVGGKKFH